jgi:hypothetical protein
MPLFLTTDNNNNNNNNLENSLNAVPPPRLLPSNKMAYVPKFFFAATLIFIAIDLLVEWLVLVYFKLLLREYLVVLGSFVLLNLYGLETGMALSIGLAMVAFIWSYSRTAKRVVTRVVKQSNVLAAPNDRMRLHRAHREIVTLELHGYLFFGSAKAIMSDVMKYVFVRNKSNKNKSEDKKMMAAAAKVARAGRDAGGAVDGCRDRGVGQQPGFLGTHRSANAEAKAATTTVKSKPRRKLEPGDKENANPTQPHVSLLSPLLPQHEHRSGRRALNASSSSSSSSSSYSSSPASSSPAAVSSLLDVLEEVEQGQHKHAAGHNGSKKIASTTAGLGVRVAVSPQKPGAATQVLILDFARCHGMDATAVRSCFLVLDQLCTKHGVRIVCAGANREIQFLLTANGLSSWKPRRFASVDDALHFAEHRVVASPGGGGGPGTAGGAGNATDMSDTTTDASRKGCERLLQISRAHLSRGDSFAPAHDGLVATYLLRMARCGALVTNSEAALLTQVEDYFSEWSVPRGAVLFRPGDPGDRCWVVKSGSVKLLEDGSRRDLTVRPGFILGEADLLLSQTRSQTARIVASRGPFEGDFEGGGGGGGKGGEEGPGAVLFELTAASLAQLETAQPAVSAVFHKILMRIMARQVSWAHGF